ncbi:MAG: TrkA family potassium uptake protein [Erysipelotrichaceae bacterium]|nr:TrkA family potassium uptake protein [Erysipelotrichaceae bacterium]
MREKRTFLVLGLGIFGSTIARELSRYGQDVIAIDRDMSCIERLADYVTHAACCDFNDIEQLKAVGAENIDCAIIATGSHLEESVMAAMNLQELKVPMIIAKAKNRKYSQILLKIGCDRVVTPEKEIGFKTAKYLVSKNIVDLIEIDKEYNIVELKAPTKWIGKSLIDLELRNKYNINVLGTRACGGEHLELSLDPNQPITENSRLLMIIGNDVFANFSKFEDVE